MNCVVGEDMKTQLAFIEYHRVKGNINKAVTAVLARIVIVMPKIFKKISVTGTCLTLKSFLSVSHD